MADSGDQELLFFDTFSHENAEVTLDNYYRTLSNHFVRACVNLVNNIISQSNVLNQMKMLAKSVGDINSEEGTLH